jgi:TnpA family transposase
MHTVAPERRRRPLCVSGGWAEIAIYMLRYIHEEHPGSRSSSIQPYGKSRHALARWLLFSNRGEFRSAARMRL